jgi:hypothetical protein
MNYEEFKRLWLWALGESRRAILGVDPLEETLDLRSTERMCKSFVDPHSHRHHAARVDDLEKGDTGAIARGMDPMGSRNHAPTRAHRSYRAR